MFAAPRRLSNIPKNDTVSQQNILYHLRRHQSIRTFVLVFFLYPKLKKVILCQHLKNGALYIRVSTADQTELSPDAQQRLLLDYAKKNGIVIAKEFIFEESVSGRHADRRPKFQEMIALAKQDSHPIDVILVWKYSRFARNQEESIVYKSLLKKNNIDVISISEPLIDGPFGTLIERIIEWMDEYYSIRLSGEVIRGMKEKALKHGYQTSPCLGYDAAGSGKPFVINEAEYSIVKFIMDQYDLENHDPTAIARSCNELGYHTKRGNLMERRSVERILRNPFYAGTVIWNGISFEGAHETRLDRERFNNRIKRMDARRRTPKSRNPSSCKHWLSRALKMPRLRRYDDGNGREHILSVLSMLEILQKASIKAPTRSQLPKQSGPSTITSMISLLVRTSPSQSAIESRSRKTMRPSSGCNRPWSIWLPAKLA